MTLSTGSYWLTVSELQADAGKYADEHVRVSGAVVLANTELTFKLIGLMHYLPSHSQHPLPACSRAWRLGPAFG